ncbi:MAG: hypothetical protein LRZ84_11750 [Desertifilum sp.]|nr:hypothetical protein [Desertifilum sp.]
MRWLFGGWGSFSLSCDRIPSPSPDRKLQPVANCPSSPARRGALETFKLDLGLLSVYPACATDREPQPLPNV